MERFFEWIGLMLYKITDRLISFFDNKLAVTGVLVCFALMFIIAQVVVTWLEPGRLYGIPLILGVCVTFLFSYLMIPRD